MALSTTIDVGVNAALTNTLDLVTGSAPLAYSKRVALATGVGFGQADRVWSDTRTLAGSGTEDLDLVGGLTDALGAAFTLAKLKAVLVVAAAGNTNRVVLTRPAANGVPLFLAASDGLEIAAGGCFLWVAPTTAAVAVTAGTGDLITVSNSGAGTSVTYDVVIIGTSA